MPRAMSLFLTIAVIPIGHFIATTLVARARTGSAMQVVAQATPPLTAAGRRLLIEAVAADVKEYYFDKQVAHTAANALLAHEQASDYNTVTDEAFANLLARHLIEASGDSHFTVEYTPKDALATAEKLAGSSLRRR